MRLIVTGVPAEPEGIAPAPDSVAFGVNVTCVLSSFATMFSDGLPADAGETFTAT
jgi:hypothetical protein